MSESSRAAGRIISFYSYKGGTGRSMALANVAWILASNGARVLIVDWDLEAPGLHRYFAPFLTDYELTGSEGVIDFLGKYADAVLSPPTIEAEKSADWYVPFADITRYAISLDWKFDDGGTLDFIGAGRQNAGYAGHVVNFPWQSFYERLGGGNLLLEAGRKMREQYDYILLDSRTGVSDAGGVCTILLPDALVVCFTLNNQSIAGAARVAQAIADMPDKAQTPIYPVPMRIEMAEKVKRDARFAYARSCFALLPRGMEPKERNDYWASIGVVYDPYYAYEEVLAVVADTPGTKVSLLATMENLTACISGGKVTKLKAMPEPTRLLYRDLYARQSERAAGDANLVRTAERVLAELPPTEQPRARKLLTSLVRVSGDDEAAADSRGRFPVSDLAEYAGTLGQLTRAGVVRVAADTSSGEETAELADDVLLQQWPRLRLWVEEDRAFLAWRQQLRASDSRWRRLGQSDEALLSGPQLADARRWVKERREDLTEQERTYVAESVARHRDESITRAAVAAAVLAGKGAPPRAAFYSMLVVAVSIGAFGFWATRLSSSSGRANVGALVSTGDLAAAAGDDSTALARYDSAMKQDSTFARAYLGRGRIYAQRRAYDLAVEDFSRALALEPTLDEAYSQRGQAFSALNQPAKAINDLARAASLRPGNASSLMALGSAFEAAGHADSALATYGAAIRADSSLAAAYSRRGQLYVQRRDTSGARADLTKAVALSAPNDSVHLDATRRLKALGVAASSATTTAIIPHVTMQYGDSTDGRTIFKVYLSLARRGYWRVDAPSREAPGPSNPPAKYDGVRFYYWEDSSVANTVRGAAQTALAEQGVTLPRPLPLYHMQLDSFPKAKRGLVEVWILSLPKPAAAK